MTEVPELRTERLLLRGWREDDFDAFVRILAEPDVARCSDLPLAGAGTRGA